MSRGEIWWIVACAVLACASRSEAACTVSANGVNFGSYSVFTTTATTSTGTVTYNCGSKDKNIEIQLSTGSGTYSGRTLKSVTDALVYNLYTDAAFTKIWGDTTSGTSDYTRANPPNGLDVSVTIYGRIPAQQDVRAGAYNDSIIATINF